MSLFERYLTVWVLLCIVAGIALGQVMPAVFAAISAMEVAKVNLPVAVLIWLMIVPMLVKIDFAALSAGDAALARHRRHAVHQLGGEAVLDGAARLVLHRLAVPALLPAGQIDSYIAGLILLAAAPCTAMVFVWSNLTRRRAAFHTVAGGAQRRDHDRRLRAARRLAARPLGDHRAVGDAAALGGALHRRAGHRRAGHPPQRARSGRRGGAAGPARSGCSRCRCWRCSPRSCCSSPSRASRSSPSRWSSRCSRCRSSSRSISIPASPICSTAGAASSIASPGPPR